MPCDPRSRREMGQGMRRMSGWPGGYQVSGVRSQVSGLRCRGPGVRDFRDTGLKQRVNKRRNHRILTEHEKQSEQ